MSGINVGLELRWWTIADGLGFIPMDDPETFHRNFDPSRKGWIPHFGPIRGIISNGNLEDIAPTTILHAPGAISVHGSFRKASLEPGPSGQELRTLPTEQLQP